MDKIDARKLSVESRAMLRQMVLRLRKQSRMTADQLAVVAGVHPSTIKKWLALARRQGEGALQEKRRGRPVGACRKLSLAQEMWIRQHIVEHTPEQMKLPFALWSRPAIRALLAEQFGLEISERLMGKYLKRWGFTPQRPVKRALEQDPVRVAAWLRQEYPQIAARAKAQGAHILWADETAVKEDANWVRGFAPAGRTPVLTLPARWNKLSMISAISARGEVVFEIVEGSIDTARFIAFLDKLLAQATAKIVLVVDNLRVHHAKAVRQWLADKEDRIELVYLPPYAPESNPDEYLNRDFKTALRSGPVAKTVDDLKAKALRFMQTLQQAPDHVRSYFRHPLARYAACI